MVSKGDIVLVRFPFTDLSQAKLRPAVIRWVNPAGDVVVLCAITSQKIDRLSPEDIPLLPTDPGFSNTGLQVPSKIRAARIASLTKQLVIRKFGSLSTQHIQLLNKKLIEVLKLI